MPRIAPYVDFWNVLNEFNLGNTPERVKCKLTSVRFHALGYHITKKYSKAPVSSAHALVRYMPLRPYDECDDFMTNYIDMVDLEFFFHAMRTGELLYPLQAGIYDKDIKNAVDYWSVNCYTRDMIDARKRLY